MYCITNDSVCVCLQNVTVDIVCFCLFAALLYREGYTAKKKICNGYFCGVVYNLCQQHDVSNKTEAYCATFPLTSGECEAIYMTSRRRRSKYRCEIVNRSR